MSALIEILIELSVRLIGFVVRNFRSLFALFVGAGFGLFLALSLARFGDVDAWMILLAVVIGAVVVAPKIVDYLNRLTPKK